MRPEIPHHEKSFHRHLIDRHCLNYNYYLWLPDYQIYITGFDSFNSDKIHYMDKMGVNDTHVKHNLDKEVKFLEHLVKKYNIKKI